MNENQNTDNQTNTTETPVVAVEVTPVVAKVEKNKPGRPKYNPVFPTTDKWTFNDFEITNGVDPQTGKGEKCSRLTLRKWLDADMYTEEGNLRKSSQIVLVKKELSPSGSIKGLGRKRLVYQFRNKVNTDKVITDNPVVETPVADVTVNVGTDTVTETPETTGISQETLNYEAKKLELFGPSIPVVEITPENSVEIVPENSVVETVNT